MRATQRNFISITSEGGLLPTDFLQALVGPKPTADGLAPTAYHLAEGEKLNEAVTRSWSRLKGCWDNFKKTTAGKAAPESTTTETRDRWLLPIFQELGFGRLKTTTAIDIEGKSYPLTHRWENVPIHLVGSTVALDTRTARVAGAATASPHSMVQQLLNRREDFLWAILSNGETLRLLRDNIALTRQSFVDFDLKAMFDGDLYADFFLFWLLCHHSRFEGDPPETCWLEKWTKAAAQKGRRALEDMRPNVAKAIAALGQGLISHRKNQPLRDKLHSGQLGRQSLYEQILRVVYRMLFIITAEDRELLLRPDGTADAITRYQRFYSLSRLRELPPYRSGTPHEDLWIAFRLVADKLGSDEGCPEIALPALGSFLWSKQATPELDAATLDNQHFLEAFRDIAFVQDGGVRRMVDYKNLGREELGAVYESLLELHPEVNPAAGTFELKSFAGNARKTTGSYYTDDSLVHCLLDSALDPVLREHERDFAKIGFKSAEEAILAIKVGDKAVGSGHFLISAAHRIARRLAAVRTGEEEPSPRALRTAIRDVIGHCLYGVDINPMAVELCKFNLWLEALEPGKPLTFLDHHIRCGNSLLGATPELIAAGLPDHAFEAMEGDDSAACSVLKKLNRAQREGLRYLFLTEDTAIRERMHQAAAAIDQMSDNRPEDIHRKEAAFRAAQSDYDFSRAWALADLWCAAFVIKKYFPPPAGMPASPQPTELHSQPRLTNAASPAQTGLFTDTEASPDPNAQRIQEPTRPGSGTPIGITTQHLRDFVEGAMLPSELLSATRRLASQYQLFHWHLAFPEVFAQGGFDVSLGNPPWERLKLQEKEWFANKRPDIASAPKTSARKQLINALRQEDPALFRDFSDALRQSEAESHFLRNSGLYPLCGRGDINVYTVFAELMRNHLDPNGRLGCILPSGIATDDTTKHFFQQIVREGSLVSLFSFENEEYLFPHVHHSMKFCLVTLAGRNRRAEKTDFIFYARQTSELANEARRFTLNAQEIALLNPNTKTCPIFRSKPDAELTKAIYRRVPILINDTDAPSNPWNMSFLRMFDSANDSNLFRTRQELEAQGFRLSSGNLVRESEQYVPLYEAKMVDTFDNRACHVVLNDTAAVRQGEAESLSTAEHRDPFAFAAPRYWVSTSDVASKLAGRWNRSWLIGWRDITASISERTNTSLAMPKAACADTILLMLPEADTTPYLPALIAAQSSFVFDYVARQKLGGIHLKYHVFKQLSNLPPSTYRVACPWSSPGQSLLEWLLPRVLELTYTAWDMRGFAQDCGWTGPPFRWQEDRRFLLRCELDAAFFHLYLGPENEWLQQPDVLTRSLPAPRAAACHIMDTFPIVQRKDMDVYGRYRTKETILEIYGALAEAQRTGTPYQTRLDPPPADPRCAHPPRPAPTVESPQHGA